MSDILRIVDWDENFEVSRSRQIKNLRWVPIPNKHDSDGYTIIISHPDGPAHYACWVTIVQVASKCQPRGTLMRAAHQGHDAASLGRVTRIPAELFESAIPRLLLVGWLERISSDGTVLETGCQEGVTQVSGGCQDSVAEGKGREGKGREGKGREGKGREEKGREGKRRTPLSPPKGDSLDLIPIPENLDTPQFRQAWADWQQHRREIRKALRFTSARKQMAQFTDWGIDRAVAAINHTIAKGWQGIREPDGQAVAGEPPPNLSFKIKGEE